ncbi:4453_t:CDS:2, partial [Acaulospora colombiana]
YSMEDRQEDADLNIESTAQAENTDVDVEEPSSSSNPAAGKPPRQGSPVPPKTLYKSTTGKGVAFTPEDVSISGTSRYGGILERSLGTSESAHTSIYHRSHSQAPHHSRASWMKYWRRHRHELEPKGDQPTPPVNVAPQKKSRYTRKDDILLAKYFFEAEGADHQERKTSDAIFQEFAAVVRNLSSHNQVY